MNSLGNGNLKILQWIMFTVVYWKAVWNVYFAVMCAYCLNAAL